MGKFLIFTLTMIVAWLVIYKVVVADNKVTVSARVVRTLEVDNSPYNGLQDAAPVQKTAGVDILRGNYDL